MDTVAVVRKLNKTVIVLTRANGNYDEYDVYLYDTLVGSIRRMLGGTGAEYTIITKPTKSTRTYKGHEGLIIACYKLQQLYTGNNSGHNSTW